MNNDPKSAARRFYDVINSWSPDALDEICSPALRGHAGAGADLAQLKQSIGSFCDAFPDLVVDLDHAVSEGDVVSTWVTYRGTHRGDFAGVPGTGKPVRFAGWDLIRLEAGLIVEITSYCDVFTLMNQIEALATPTPASA